MEKTLQRGLEQFSLGLKFDTLWQAVETVQQKSGEPSTCVLHSTHTFQQVSMCSSLYAVSCKRGQLDSTSLNISSILAYVLKQFKPIHLQIFCWWIHVQIRLSGLSQDVWACGYSPALIFGTFNFCHGENGQDSVKHTTDLFANDIIDKILTQCSNKSSSISLSFITAWKSKTLKIHSGRWKIAFNSQFYGSTNIQTINCLWTDTVWKTCNQSENKQSITQSPTYSILDKPFCCSGRNDFKSV